MKGKDNPFQVGKEIPTVWIHMEFDFADTQKYWEDRIVKTQDEADRLTRKYWD